MCDRYIHAFEFIYDQQMNPFQLFDDEVKTGKTITQSGINNFRKKAKGKKSLGK